MDQVARLMKQPRTPETPREIASIISASQFTQAGPYNVSDKDFSSLLVTLATTARFRDILFLIYSYTADHRFNPDQTVLLGLTIVERFGQPIQDPSRFVAMGGMPADDDDDVVFVKEEKEDGRINNLRQDIGKAKNQVTATKDTAEQARVKCDKLEVRRDECKSLLIKALSDVKEAANDFGIKRHAQAQAERDLQALEAELAKLEPKDQGPAAKRHKP